LAGAYALLLELPVAARLPPSLGPSLLPPGRYCYLGSARGPGGIRARCRRHLAGSPKRHWHVDWIAPRAARIHALPLPGAHECELVRRLLQGSGVAVPVPGFGSSDCRRCPTHLLAARLDPLLLAARLGATEPPGPAPRQGRAPKKVRPAAHADRSGSG
jgi:Uri superfamily endonuclease